jgi:hypothetical protein
LYFGEGKLVVVRRPQASPHETKVEFFWLCGECATHLNLEIPSNGIPHIVPRLPISELVTAH